MPGKRKQTNSKDSEQKTKIVKQSEDQKDENLSHWCGYRVPGDLSSFTYEGLCCAPNTAFNKDGELDTSPIKDFVDRLIRNGVHAAFVCGTMGESVSMTVDERKKVIEAWIEASKDKDFNVFCHIGCESLYDTIELAKHSESIGVKAIALIPPSFFKPSNMDGLIEWLAAVGKAVPKTPIYYYHYDDATGVKVATQLLLKRAHEKVPNLCGMKFTNYNLFELERCLSLGKYNMLLGREDSLLGGLAIGVPGGIGASFSCVGHEASLIMEYFKKGDLKEALEHQKKVNEFAEVLYYNEGRYGNGVGSIELMKSVLKMTGLDVGYARLPRKKLTAQAEKLLKDDLKKIGFFDWCDK